MEAWIEARLWADQLDRDLADPGIRSGTMVWMPASAIRDVAAVLRKLASPNRGGVTPVDTAGGVARDGQK